MTPRVASAPRRRAHSYRAGSGGPDRAGAASSWLRGETHTPDCPKRSVVPTRWAAGAGTIRAARRLPRGRPLPPCGSFPSSSFARLREYERARRPPRCLRPLSRLDVAPDRTGGRRVAGFTLAMVDLRRDHPPCFVSGTAARDGLSARHRQLRWSRRRRARLRSRSTLAGSAR